MAGFIDTMKANLSPVSLTGKPPNRTPALPTVISGPEWGEGRGQHKLTPETANNSAASVMR